MTEEEFERTIVVRGHVTAEGLMRTVGPEHPLKLPISRDALRWYDFSELQFGLARLIDDKRPKLPVDISPLVQLCQEHADEITEDDWWVYRYFYLELLDQEETLRPLFWGTRDVAVQLREDDVVAAHLSGVPVSDASKVELRSGIYNRNEARWSSEGQIEQRDGQPWLSYLRCREPNPKGNETVGDMGFGERLEFAKLPFYAIPGHAWELIQAMKMELWETSIFSPAPKANRNAKEFDAARDRFVLWYQRMTEQEIRKNRFERLVRKQWGNQVPKKAIGREAVQRGLWPYGKRKSNCEPTHDDDVENCRRAVIRLIKKREEAWRKEQA